jgi:NAD(P)-dependent dehydrogenase (short-subunit alcohol dehydrogenase family)
MRRALVTGASRGIGRAVALALSSAGHSVAACARTTTGLEETVRLADPAAAAIAPIALDAGNLAECAELPALVADALGGPVDILVHSAGISRPSRVTELSLDDWDESMRVNATSALVLAQACAPAMQAAGWGRIVTIGSLYSRMGAPFSGAYAVSKHALLGLTRVLAVELIRDGITANCVIPGWTDTEMVRTEARNVAAARGISEDEAIRRFLRNQPLGRMVTPDEVGGLVAYLCSDAAGSVTGQAINIDGGSLQS